MELPVIPLRISLPILTIVAATSACTQMPYSIDTHVNSTPQTVSWGHLPGGRQPVARVQQAHPQRLPDLLDDLQIRRYHRAAVNPEADHVAPQCLMSLRH